MRPTSLVSSTWAVRSRFAAGLALSAGLVLVSVGPRAYGSDNPVGRSFAVKGPLATKTESVTLTPGGERAKIMYPASSAGTLIPIVLGHGFSAGPENQVGWGEHLASYGFVAIAPQLCTGTACAPRPEQAPAIVENTLKFLRGTEAPLSLRGHVDPTRFALLGHSGGGQALIAVSARLSPAAIVLFDPVSGSSPLDRDTAVALRALNGNCAPLLTLYAEPHDSALSCNKRGLWHSIGNDTAGPNKAAVVIGSSHCDGENTPRGLCAAPGFGCGNAAKPVHRDSLAHYATAWFLSILNQDGQATRAVSDDTLLADPALREVQVRNASAASCGGGPPGPSVVPSAPDKKDDAAVSEAKPSSPPTPSPASPAPLGAQVPSSAAPNATNDSSSNTTDAAMTDAGGCSVSGSETAAARWPLGVLLASVLLVRRRRR